MPKQRSSERSSEHSSQSSSQPASHGDLSKDISTDPSMVVSLCPSCHETIARRRTESLSTQNGMALIHGSCTQCHTAVLILELGEGSMVTSIGVMTDLQQNEVNRFWEISPVSDDEVIALHQQLQQPSVVDTFIEQL